MQTNLASLKGDECVVVPRRMYERLTRLIHEAALPPMPEPDARGFYPAVESLRAMTARELICERLSLELTRAELARLAGVRASTVERAESGNDSITPRAQRKLDAALKRAARSRRVLRKRA